MNNYLKKQNLLDSTNNGEEIYHFILSKYGLKLQVNKPILNPFYSDKNPSLSFYLGRDGYIRFKDFGNSKYQGDCFEFAALHYRLDLMLKGNFRKLLIQINKDLNLGFIEFEDNVKENKNENVCTRPFTRNDINFWLQYGISENMLKEYKVHSVYYYFSKNNQFNTKADKCVFAYKIQEKCWKIYRPGEKNYKFFWIGQKPVDYIFGYEQLDDFGEYVFITGAEKDSICLRAQGYNAISLNSETSTNIPEDILKDLHARFSYIIVLYDTYYTGKREALNLSQKYKLLNLELPEISDSNCKDISDYFANYIKEDQMIDFTPEIFKESIEMLLKPYKQSIHVFSESLVDNLPDFLQLLLEPFKVPEQRDLVLITTLAILSNVYFHVFGYYDRQKIYPNFYIYIVGEASSGKGVVSNVKVLGKDIHNHLIETSEVVEPKTKNGTATKKYKMLFIPANSSSAGIYELLFNNNGTGIIFETEGETLSNALNNSIGNFMDLIRKSYHHETLSSFRKSNNEYFHIQ